MRETLINYVYLRTHVGQYTGFSQLTEIAKVSVEFHTIEMVWCNILERICAKNNVLFKVTCHKLISPGTFVGDPY